MQMLTQIAGPITAPDLVPTLGPILAPIGGIPTRGQMESLWPSNLATGGGVVPQPPQIGALGTLLVLAGALALLRGR